MASDGTSYFSYKRIKRLVRDLIYRPAQRYLAPTSPATASAERSTAPKKSDTTNMATGFSTVVLPDGARLAYEVLGSYYLGQTTPIVFICGMTAIRSDLDRVSRVLAKSHPVLLYDHRGMGDSTSSPSEGEDITIELLARDLLFLLTHLKWREIALCGHSMGGIIAQQMLVLPWHATKPTTIPFRTTHLFLVGTRCRVHQAAGLPITAIPGRPRSLEERKEGARRVIAATLDPAWMEANRGRFEYLFNRAVDNNLSNRPGEMIAKQGVALRKFAFEELLGNLPRDMQVMIVHGQLDQVVPLFCGEDILKHMPWAQFVEQGPQPGQVPTLDFGHLWYEYFDPQVWHDVLHVFMQKPAIHLAGDCPTTTREFMN